MCAHICTYLHYSDFVSVVYLSILSQLLPEGSHCTLHVLSLSGILRVNISFS